MRLVSLVYGTGSRLSTDLTPAILISQNGVSALKSTWIGKKSFGFPRIENSNEPSEFDWSITGNDQINVVFRLSNW